MTMSSASVVTAARYANAMTWQQYLTYIGSEANPAREAPGGGKHQDNTERFTRNDKGYTLKPEHVEALRQLPKIKVLVIGEDWCPDVHRGAPVLARMAETAGWDFRIVQRDENKDIIAEFLNKTDDGAYESIPDAVVYTADHRYVGHWIERPKIATEYMANLQKTFTRSEGESEDEMRDRIRTSYRALQQSDEWNRWRHATVDEILSIAREGVATR